MNYHKVITLKDGRTCVIQNGTAENGQAPLDIFNLTHAQRDFLLTYPKKSTHTARQEALYSVLRRGPTARRGQTVHIRSFLKRVKGGIPGTWLYASGGGQ